MKLIVAAIDFSPAASAAARRAARIAAAAGARLALLHVARHRSGWSGVGDAAAVAAPLEREAARIRTEHGVPVEAYLAKGAPHKAIAAFARDAGADLVVLGLRGGFLRDLLGGGTTRRVRRRLAVPVLAVARESRGPYRRVLVTTDFSVASTRGAALAARMFPQAEIHVLHVCRPLFDGMLSYAGVSERAREEYRGRTLLHAMHRLRAFASHIGQTQAAAAVRLGHVPAEIRYYAAKTGADLVVVAPGERSLLKKIAFVSVADELLAHADHDTLVVGPGLPGNDLRRHHAGIRPTDPLRS
jgi:nucleotide-binding universal stress UspA family protein